MIGVNLRDKIRNIHGRLFQAAMWREYAKASLGLPNRFGYTWEYMQVVHRTSYTQCVRRARVNLYLARRLNRSEAMAAQSNS